MKRERSEEEEKIPVLIVGLHEESYVYLKAGTLTPLEFKVLAPLAGSLPHMRLDIVTRDPKSVLRKIYHYRTEPGEDNEIYEFTCEPTTEGDFCDVELEDAYNVPRHALVWMLYQ